MLDRTIEVDPIRLVNLVCLHVYAFKRHKVDLHIIFFSEGHQLLMWSSFDDVFPIQPLWFPLRSSASDPPNVNTLCLTASRLLFLGPPFLFLAFANVTSIRSSSNSPLVFGGRVSSFLPCFSGPPPLPLPYLLFGTEVPTWLSLKPHTAGAHMHCRAIIPLLIPNSLGLTFPT